MTKADTVTLVCAIALLPYLYLHYWGTSTAVADVAVIQSGTDNAVEIPLETDQRLNIAGPLGDTVIEVDQGRVRFVKSPCRGKQCIHSGWLHKSGEFAACLPNKISLAVTGKIPRFDAINF